MVCAGNTLLRQKLSGGVMYYVGSDMNRRHFESVERLYNRYHVT